jgi:hypothetical protein
MRYSWLWWWWWIGFFLIFFVLPLAYGWGYRGWGPWYRRRAGARTRASQDRSPEGTDRLESSDIGWGWLGIALWVALFIAIGWAIALLWGA